MFRGPKITAGVNLVTALLRHTDTAAQKEEYVNRELLPLVFNMHLI